MGISQGDSMSTVSNGIGNDVFTLISQRKLAIFSKMFNYRHPGKD
ncbi:hypothetical protein [Chryseosolibacter indicus]|nr:hypothetical protein [Chryseosolibacter indicus]